MKIRLSRGDRIVTVLNYIFCFLLAFITAYPIIYVISMSISDPTAVMANRVKLLPVGFSTKAFGIVLRNPFVWTAYGNTFIYTIFGTLLSVFLTFCAAFPLVRKDFVFRKALTIYYSITMFFGGTMISSYLLINDLGLYDTRWAIILPGGAAAYYIFMCRTFLESIPNELTESAIIDGANEAEILTRIYLPLSKPILAVLTLYYAVGQWNSYFNALLYLPSRELQPLQLYLMQVLMQNSNTLSAGSTMNNLDRSMVSLQLKYVIIVVSTVPILLFYPFIQKYFVKGVMVGAIKG